MKGLFREATPQERKIAALLSPPIEAQVTVVTPVQVFEIKKPKRDRAAYMVTYRAKQKAKKQAV